MAHNTFLNENVNITAAGVLPICIYKNEIFVLLGRESSNNKFCGFGGSREPEETVQECCSREFREESLDAIPNGNVLFSCISKINTKDWYYFEIRLIALLGDYVSLFNKKRMKETRKTHLEKSEIKFFKLDDLLNMVDNNSSELRSCFLRSIKDLTSSYCFYCLIKQHIKNEYYNI